MCFVYFLAVSITNGCIMFSIGLVSFSKNTEKTMALHSLE